MINITMAQIEAAQDSDLAATTAVLSAMEERVLQHASAKRSFGAGNAPDEDLAQEGRLAAWQSLDTFRGSTVGEFFAYVDRTISGAMSAARISAEGGVSVAAMKRFERAVRLSGDADSARRDVQDTKLMGGPFNTLSADLAHAAHAQYTSRGVSADAEAALPGDVPADLIEASDLNAARRASTVAQVHETLVRLGGQQRVVLMGLTGIGDVAEYGTERDDDLAADHGIPRDRVRVIRSKGKARFAQLYTERYSL